MAGIPAEAWSSLFTALVGLLIAYLQSRTNVRVDKVKEITLDTKDYCNSLMKIQLAMHATTTERLAALTHQPADVEAARKAKKDLDAHVAAQEKIDAKAALK